ncbi:13723_t:CDS:2, partial [Racocetra persica]
KLLDNSGHYEAICKTCNRLFSSGKPSQMEKHIISKYSNVSETIKEAVIYIVESHNKSSGTKFLNEQLSLNKYLENTTIPDKHIESINRALIKVFTSSTGKSLWNFVIYLDD